ncbi:MAG: hypothetical protein ACI9C1_000884 [Candidatus Aldehydirespiratoraceae bacterium]|jgi:uncharacterized protein (DUF1800 family)
MLIDEANAPSEDVEEGRRAFLGVNSLKKVVALAGSVAVLSAACDAVGDSGNPDMLLMKRATYGVTQEIIDRVAAIGAAAWVTEQLDWASLDTSAIDAKITTMPAVTMSPSQLMANYPDSDIVDALVQMITASAIRQIEGPAQIYERMVEFWSDHLNVAAADEILRLLKVVEDREVIRPHALGKYKELLVASAQSPAMLVYLDNAYSVKNGINENYSRELLELHTLGVDAGYDHDDIVAVAELLTGWSVDPNTGLFTFRLNQHDTGFQSILGWDRPGDTNYLDHGVQFLHHLALHPNTAAFVCTKLARRFVNDMPDPALVADLAAVYLANDSDIKPVLEALFAHPTFLASSGQKLRRPQEFLVAIARQVGGELQPTTLATESGSLSTTAIGLGQAPFQWPHPNGYPDVATAWLNTGGLLARWNAVSDVAWNQLDLLSYDHDAARAGIPAQPLGPMASQLSENLLHEPLTTNGQHVIAQYFGETIDAPKDPLWLSLHLPSLVALILASNDNQFT